MNPSRYWSNYTRDLDANRRQPNPKFENDYKAYLDRQIQDMKSENELLSAIEKVDRQRQQIEDRTYPAMTALCNAVVEQQVELRVQLRRAGERFPEPPPGVVRRVGRLLLKGFLVLGLLYTLAMLNIILLGAFATACDMLTPSWMDLKPYPPIVSVFWAVAFVSHRRGRWAVYVLFGSSIWFLVFAGMMWQVWDVIRG
ncbi:hypothetical protein PRZ48_006066 [Zasmidium cellare]|uniref:Uncharacterized protein n=1 Tax=Zasmidium cellare TaxID=395010 RepID=A0ABR0EMD9_ZASCE|nr:hypothetical protein PRZ48_006066 [Zasmidium cellare]